MFNIDTLRAERHLEPFPFVLDGEELSLPHPESLPGNAALRLDRGELAEVLPTVVGEELSARILAQPIFVIEALMAAWLEHAGLAQGESAASTAS